MIDTDKYEGHTPASWEWRGNFLIHMKQQDSIDIIDIGNHLTPLHPSMNIKEDELLADLKLIADAPLLLAEVKQLREQYTELREALVGDSPNWTHEELIERALEISKPVELEFGEWHSDMGEE